jgi:protein-disulfide isomerase
MRLSALALALSLPIALPAAAEMTPEERAAFRDEMRAYLLENPEVIVEAMTILQMRENEAAAAADIAAVGANRDAIEASASDWVGGNPEGDITVVEFMDYRCGYCKKAVEEVEALVRTDGNIRFVLKEFPVLGEPSLLASQFAIAVRQLHGDDAYKAAHDALFALRAEISQPTLDALAAQLGHDPAAIRTHMAGTEVRAVIEANYALADALAINGTPTFVMGTTLLRGYVPLSDMQAIVAEERAGG